jgi:hypothetical protein
MPREHQPEHPFRQPFGQRAPADHRNPVIKGREQRKDHAADQDIMEVRDDEITVVRLPVEGHHRDHHPGKPAGHEDDDAAEHEQPLAH